MKAGVLVGHKDIRYTDWPDPVMGDHDVLVGIRIAGICGSDLPRVLGTDVHYYPIVLGHEFAGEVLQVGSAVTRVKVGDRVAGAPLVPCHTCPDCLAGGYGQCDHRTYMGTRIQGGWAERIALPEANAVPVPDELPFEQAALLEPSAVAAHALKVVEYQNGEDVAVVGAGTIGLLVLQWARVNGAKRIVIFSRNSARLELALQLGADVAINPGDPDWLDRVNELTDGRGFGYVFESIGVSSSVRQALQLAARRGRVCWIGTLTEDFTLTPTDFALLQRKELRVVASWQAYSAPFPGEEWHLAAQHYASGRIRCMELIEEIMPLADIKTAFQRLADRGSVRGKILFRP